VLIFTVVNSIFTQNNLETDIQQIAKGVIIVAAVLLQATTIRRRKKTTT
jgi:ribose transport system permease protein